MGLAKKLDINRLTLVGVMLLALAATGCSPPPRPPVATSHSNELVFKAPPSPGYIRVTKPRNPPASASKNDALYRQFLEWHKKHPQ
jgi:hypothetical protein